MIDLKPFCASENDARYFIQNPISDSQYTYATNGYIIIRVGLRPEYPKNGFSKQCAKLFENLSPRDNYVVIPSVELSTRVKCDNCKGEGIFLKGEEDEYVCDECDGEGTIIPFKATKVGNSNFQDKYLALLKTLPSCELSPNGMNPAHFRFDCGDGLLTPCKK